MRISPRVKSWSPAVYCAATSRATASLTVASSPVSAMKSIQISPPIDAASVGAPRAPRGPRTAAIRPRSSAGASGTIHCRESTLSVAIALARRCRRCPQNELNPNHAMARGATRPRLRRCGESGGQLARRMGRGSKAPPHTTRRRGCYVRHRAIMTLASDIARSMRDGFDKHYRLFRETSAASKQRFERGDWASVREASRARIQMYDHRVNEAVAVIRETFPAVVRDESIWPEIKLAYIGLLHEHRQPECAETFFNSVACRVLDRRYYRHEYIFLRPAISTEHLDGDEPTYHCYYPMKEGLRSTVHSILTSFGLSGRFQDLDRDIRNIVRAVREHFPGKWKVQPNFQIQVLSSLFYRNKAAYLVGRAINGSEIVPLVMPLLKDEHGAIYVDSLLLKPENIGRVFSLARAYFMVDMEVPSAYVAFLQTILPSKPKAEFYTMLGLQKQGKTHFFRDLMEHMKHSTDTFVLAPGTKGLVMVVFTCPSFPYVFKVIRDWFEPPKQGDRQIGRASC